MKLLRSLYINQIFFIALAVIGALFFIAFFIDWLFYFAAVLLGALIFAFFIDVFILYAIKKGVNAERFLPDRFSNGDNNLIRIKITNLYPFDLQTVYPPAFLCVHISSPNLAPAPETLRRV